MTAPRSLPYPEHVVRGANWLADQPNWPPQPAEELATRFGFSLSDALEAVNAAARMKMLRRVFS